MASRSLGTLSIDIVAKTAGFTAGMDKAARDAKTKLTQIEKIALGAGKAIGTGIRFAAVGIAAATTALTALTVQSINYADELQDLSGKLGISTEQLSKWAYVANLSGTDIDTVARSVNLLGKNIAAAADPTSKMAETFKALGISIRDANGNLRSGESVLPELADRFKALDNQSTETALALQLLGKSGAEMLEFLNRGAGGIKTLEDELQSLGGVINSETAKAAEEFKDELGRLKIMGQGLGLQIAQQLLPTLIDTAKEFRQLVKDGNLAANVVGVISTAMNAGISVINGYNIAVERTSLLMEAAAKSAAGAIEAYKNFATLGFADGGVASGLSKMLNAPLEATAQAKQLQAIREAQAKLVDVTLVDPGEGLEAWKQQKAIAADAAALQARLNKLLEGKAPAAAKAKKATDELDKAEEERLRLLKEQQKAADALVESERELYHQREADAQQLVSDIGFEIELLKMGNAERDTAIQLRGMEAEQVQKYGEEIAKANEELYKQMQQVELMDGARDAFATFFEDTISGAESVTDAFKNMLDDINAMILRRITENWVEQLFGAFGSTQGGAAGGNWFQMLAGIFGAGMANGGKASPWSIHEVNERGLEMATVGGRDFMLTGNQPVQVTPNHKLGGGVSQVNQFTIHGRIDRRTEDQIAEKVGWKTQVAMARNG